MHGSKLRKSFALISAATALLSVGIQATETGGYGLEEINVTARRISENLQDTPVAVSAFTGGELERRQIRGTEDLGKITPNLEFTNNAPLAGNNSSSQVFIRGIGQVDPTAGVDPGVGLYIDDVYMGQSVGGTLSMRDIVGVQVLRGPQGTLFGRNTIGGAVLLTTTQPGEEFGGSIKLGVGSDNLREVFAAVDLPVSDELKTRFTYGGKKQDGYVERVFDGEDLGDVNNYTLTAKAVFTPNNALEFKLHFDYTKADENGSPLVFAASNESATFQRVASADAGCPGFGGDWNALPAVPLINDSRCANDFWAAGEYKNNGTAPLKSELENRGASFHIAYDVNEDITLKSITSYRELEWSGNRDADNTPFTILHTDYDSEGDQFSQEFQLLYTAAAVTGVTGLYYYEEDITDILTVALNTPAPGEQLDSDNNRVQNDNWAFFTQWSYHFTNKLSGSLGVRHTEETKGSTPNQFNFATPTQKYLPVKLYEQDFSATTASADLSYRWNESLMTYISYSEGFKSGGFNSHFNVPQSAATLALFHQFGEETAEAWELGFKTDLLNDTLRLNGAIFSTDYTDLQFIFRVGVAPYLLNAGEASIEGAELELTWVPTDSWIFEVGLGYLDDSIDSIATNFAALGAATAITTDNTLPYTPRWQGSLGIGYSLTVNGFGISPRIDASYRKETYFDTSNTEEIAQLDTITTVDASVSIEPNGADWRLILGVNNATDKTYPIAGNSSLGTGSGYAEIAYARPRQYFLSLNYDF